MTEAANPARIRTQGVVAAVAAYAAWGFLAPGAKLLLPFADPFTLNFHRTWLSVVAFVVIFGPRRSLAAFRLLGRDWRPWLLGVIGLGFTLHFYLMSLTILAPTISAVLLYFAPLLIAWLAHRYFGEHYSLWLPLTAVVTLVAVTVAVLEPFDGVRMSGGNWLGLAYGVTSVAGWCFYTLYLRHLSSRYTDHELTLTAFATSGVVFLLGGIVFEGLAFVANPESLGLLALYVALSSVLSFGLYTVAIRRAGAAVVSVLIGIELVSTAIVSGALGLETFFWPENWQKIVGMCVVVLAVTLFLWHQARVPEGTPVQVEETPGASARPR